MLDDLDLSSITDERMRTLIVRLLNIIEEQAAALRDAQTEIQRLRDEVNRLKGEQGKPTIKPPTPPSPPAHYSSEPERHQRGARGKRGKRAPIAIDRDALLTVDPASLPSDAIFKGYEEVIVQDILVRTDNVCFRKEVWYAPSTTQSYRAPLPPGYAGEFGPGIHALVVVLAYGCLVSEAKIRELLTNVGVQIADGTISNLLIKDQTVFHREADAILRAGLASSPWQQIDDTGTRVNPCERSEPALPNCLYPAGDLLPDNGQQRSLIGAGCIAGRGPPQLSVECRSIGVAGSGQGVAGHAHQPAGPAVGYRSGRANPGRAAGDPPAAAGRSGAEVDSGCAGRGGLSRANRVSRGALAGL